MGCGTCLVLGACSPAVQAGLLPSRGPPPALGSGTPRGRVAPLPGGPAHEETLGHSSRPASVHGRSPRVPAPLSPSQKGLVPQQAPCVTPLLPGAHRRQLLWAEQWASLGLPGLRDQDSPGLRHRTPLDSGMQLPWTQGWGLTWTQGKGLTWTHKYGPSFPSLWLHHRCVAYSVRCKLRHAKERVF